MNSNESKERISNIAESLLTNKITVEMEVLPLMNLVTPTFYLVVKDGELYFVYLLQDHVVKTRSSHYEIQEILLVNTTEETLKMLLAKQISIYAAIDQTENKYRVGKVGKTLFPMKKVVNLKEVADRIPNKGYYLELDETLVSGILNGFERLLTNLEKGVD